MASYLQDIATFLEDEGFGNIGEDIFAARDVSSDTLNVGRNIILLKDTGEFDPSRYLTSKKYTLQVVVKNEDYDDGDAIIKQVRSSLHGILNQTIGSTHFFSIFALSGPGHIGRDVTDSNGLEIFSSNYEVYIRE